MIRLVNDPKEFDQKVFGRDGVPTLPDAGDLEIILKANGTIAGNAIAALVFTAQLPDGKLVRAQTVATVRNLLLALRVIEGWEAGGHLDATGASP